MKQRNPERREQHQSQTQRGAANVIHSNGQACPPIHSTVIAPYPNWRPSCVLWFSPLNFPKEKKENKLELDVEKKIKNRNNWTPLYIIWLSLITTCAIHSRHFLASQCLPVSFSVGWQLISSFIGSISTKHRPVPRAVISISLIGFSFWNWTGLSDYVIYESETEPLFPS